LLAEVRRLKVEAARQAERCLWGSDPSGPTYP